MTMSGLTNTEIISAAHSGGEHGAIHEFLTEHLGAFGSFVEEVILHGILDTLKPVLFLFLTYLFMEFLEHKAKGKLEGFMSKAGGWGPLVGGIFGAAPQCGFSAAAANLYTGGIISVGTLVAVFLSTSDEMLPILISEEIAIKTVLLIILYKTLVGIFMGFAIDGGLRLMRRPTKHGHVEDLCEEEGCHCEDGIFRSALRHTLIVTFFIFVITIAINTAVFFIGEDNLSRFAVNIPGVSHLICAFVGLVPNCAASVLLTRLATEGIITTGAMMSGLFSGAGIGLAVLFRVGKRRVVENLIITASVVLIGTLFGFVADFIPFLAI